MLEDANNGLRDYFTAWDKLVATRSDKTFFTDLKPVAIGWKVADRAEYDKLYQELHDAADKIIETWMNGRWVAKVHLKDSGLERGIEIVKLMQRRPGSTDEVGLDHVDFCSPTADRAEAVLSAEADLKWTEESNDAVEDYRWISLWFEAGEAKIKSYTVLGTIVRELRALEQTIIDKPAK